MMRRKGQPVLGGYDEACRLHEIAKTAALQTGAKGLELDNVIASILSTLLAQSNRAIIAERARPRLQLVKQ
jgi:hypothetical protein